MTTTRRAFLTSILAAASAPAIVRAGSLMPIWAPPPLLLPFPGFWQDAAGLIPCTAIGDPVGRADRFVRVGDEWVPMAQPILSLRPALTLLEGRPAVSFVSGTHFLAQSPAFK